MPTGRACGNGLSREVIEHMFKFESFSHRDKVYSCFEREGSEASFIFVVCMVQQVGGPMSTARDILHLSWKVQALKTCVNFCSGATDILPSRGSSFRISPNSFQNRNDAPTKSIFSFDLLEFDKCQRSDLHRILYYG